MWSFEPSVASALFNEMVDAETINVRYHLPLVWESGVKLKEGIILSITMESGETYRGDFFIDTRKRTPTHMHLSSMIRAGR